METSELSVEEKGNVMENSYAMFQFRQAVGRSQLFFKIVVLEKLPNFTGKILCQIPFLIKNFVRFKWRLKRKHSPVKCVIHTTEICPVEICLYENFNMFFPVI